MKRLLSFFSVFLVLTLFFDVIQVNASDLDSDIMPLSDYTDRIDFDNINFIFTDAAKEYISNYDNDSISDYQKKLSYLNSLYSKNSDYDSYIPVCATTVNSGEIVMMFAYNDSRSTIDFGTTHTYFGSKPNQLILSGHFYKVIFNTSGSLRSKSDDNVLAMPPSQYGSNVVYFLIVPEKKQLSFTLSSEFHNNMSLSDYDSSFQIDVKNTTDHIYNYVVFVSDKPADQNLYASFLNSKYMMSSKQWCYLYVNQTSKPDNLGTNIFETLYNIYGGDIIDKNGKLHDLYDLYVSSNSTHCEFYQLCNTICPFYQVFNYSDHNFNLWAGQNQLYERTHVINYKDLALEVNKQYYLNIAYIDMTDFKLYGSNDVAVANLAYPVFRDDFLNSYSLYSCTPFSFSDGIFQKNDSDLYGYSDYYHYLNPGSASGYISSSDNSVSTNNSNNSSDDHSIQTIYNNYGTIYHGNSNFLNGSSGSSSGSGSSPDLPDVDSFKALTDKTGNFFDFIKSIWIASGWLPAALFVTAVTVAIFCRVAGR